MRKILVVIVLIGAVAYWLYSINLIEDIRIELTLKKLEKLVEEKNFPWLAGYVSDTYSDSEGYCRSERLSWLENNAGIEKGIKVNFEKHSKKFDGRNKCHVEYVIRIGVPKSSGTYEAEQVIFKTVFQKEADGNWRIVAGEEKKSGI